MLETSRMPGMTLRFRTFLIAALVFVLSLAFTARSFQKDRDAALVKQGVDVVAALASVAATLNFAVRDTAAFLNGLTPLIASADKASCQRDLAAMLGSSVAGSIRQVFIVRDDTAVCQSAPGPFSVFDEHGARRQWAVAPKGGAPLVSGDPNLGATSREWVVVVAKHEPSKHGMVVASLSLSTLNRLVFDDLPSSTLVTVTDENGLTILRSEDFEDRVGRLVPFQQQVEGVSRSRFGLPVSRTADGSLRVTQSEPVISPDADGVMRVWSGRALTPMPWVAFAGRQVDAAYTTEWLRNAVSTATPALVLLGVILWLLASLSRELRAVKEYVAQVARDGNMLAPRRFVAEFTPLVETFREAFDLRKAAELQLEQSNQELSERVEARLAQVRRTEAFRDAVMETSLDALLVVDGDGNIVGANTGVEHVLGFSRHELLGRHLATTIVPPDFRDAHLNAFGRRAAADSDLRGLRVELPVLHADGRTFPAEIVISTTRLEGQFFSVGFIRDITERTRIEGELRAAMVAATAAARSKSEFLATMSHEIRTPLNGIMGMLDLLIDSPSDASRTGRLTIARQSADTLLQLLNDILDCSRLDAGRAELEPVEFDLRLLVAEVADLIGEAAKQKGLTLTWHASAEVPKRWRADRARLRQVLFNLASNAVKFTPHGRIEIGADMIGITTASPRVRLFVEDTGVGIAAEHQADVFEPFVQVDSSMTRRFGGTGLGLAIAKALVERMGGAVGVTSEPGAGSIFWVELDVAPLAESSAAATGLAPAATAGPACILIVEDDPASQVVASEALSRAGHRCDIAPDGPAALRLAATTVYDLILMDCRLPGTDGCDVTRSLRGAGFCGPILAVTAQTEEDVRQACLDVGMDSVLIKPIAPARLVAVVDSWLAGRP